ncbi:MAG: hypothetical protein M1840_005081 [Geoglossum simile]|nr:MAG: hypothetical protein M1840_005081 [Geoglossum simile]
MTRASQAAERDPDAPSAVNQQVRGLHNTPGIIVNPHGATESAVNSLGYILRQALRPGPNWWRRIEVHGNLIRETQTKQVNSLGCEVRIDRFPWLDISDKATLRNSPCELNILDGIAAARKNGDRIDTFDMSEYDTYIAEYEGRNNEGDDGLKRNGS